MMNMKIWRQLAVSRRGRRSVRARLAANEAAITECKRRIDGWDQAASVTAAGRHRKSHLKVVRSKAG